MIKETPHIRITAGVDVKAKRHEWVLRYLLNRIIIELLVASGSGFAICVAFALAARANVGASCNLPCKFCLSEYCCTSCWAKAFASAAALAAAALCSTSLLQLVARQALAGLRGYWVVVADFPYPQVPAHILTKSNYL